MSEQGPPLLTALTDERAELETIDPLSAHTPGVLKRRLAAQISQIFPGINHNQVIRQAFRITGDLAAADDVQQDFYVNLLCMSPEDRAAIRTLDAFVTASVRNLSIKWRHKHHPRNHLPLEDDFDERVHEDCSVRVSDEDEINFMLHQIPPDCREAFYYFVAEDCTVREVAERLGIKFEAAKKRLQRAALKLAEARRVFCVRDPKDSARASSQPTPPISKESPDGKH